MPHYLLDELIAEASTGIACDDYQDATDRQQRERRDAEVEFFERMADAASE